MAKQQSIQINLWTEARGLPGPREAGVAESPRTPQNRFKAIWNSLGSRNVAPWVLPCWPPHHQQAPPAGPPVPASLHVSDSPPPPPSSPSSSSSPHPHLKAANASNGITNQFPPHSEASALRSRPPVVHLKVTVPRESSKQHWFST